jgi:hypothetical protein
MNEKGVFYAPKEVRPVLPELVPVYQEAFAGEPWFEVTKCEDVANIKRCATGFSEMPLGSTCAECGNCLVRTAYERDELIQRFESDAKKFPTAWYIERNGENGEISLAAVAWLASASQIAQEKYPESPYMEQWIRGAVGIESILWLDEIFADKSKKAKGNLANFRQMCEGFADELGARTLAFRTINLRLINAVKRDFPSAQVYEREKTVPDRRDFIAVTVPFKANPKPDNPNLYLGYNFR